MSREENLEEITRGDCQNKEENEIDRFLGWERGYEWRPIEEEEEKDKGERVMIKLVFDS